MTPYYLLTSKITITSPPDSYTPSKHKRRPPHRRFSRMLTFILLLFALLVKSTGSSSPFKKVGKYHEFASPKTGLTSNLSNTNSTSQAEDSPIGDGNHDNKLNNNELCKKVDELFGGWVNKKVIKRLKGLIIDEDSKWNGHNNDSIRLAVRNYLLGLLECDDSSISRIFKKRQTSLGKKIDRLQKGKGGGNWLSNFGEGISDLTEGILLANYAPTSDSRQQNEQYKPVTAKELTTASGEGKYFGCRIPRTNPCMAKFIKVSIMC